MTYVFDTSSLIGAWFRTYPPDVFPRLWQNMDDLAHSGRLLVPEEVMFELKAQDDDLLTWVKDRSDLIVTPTSRAVMLEARAILVDHKHLTKTGTGRGRADPFVIALAAIRECPVVTQERGGSADKPRIPYVCGVRQIPCMAILDVIRAEGWRFA
ncbi:MAG: DUF4411 family protein [Sciscionella sp.]